MTTLTRAVSVLSLALAVITFVPPAAAQTTTPPDVVRLRDGTFLRGTIAERSPTQVVVVLPTGETRTYPADQVEFAGPDVPAAPAIVQSPPQVIAAPPREPMARLHVRASAPELSLQRLQGSATVAVWTGQTMGSARIDQFGIICNAPCDVEIPEGTYQLGIAQGTGDARRAGRPVDLRGDVTLDLRYESRTGMRIGGWVLFGLGAAAGGGLMVGSLFVGDSILDTNLPMLISGGAVLIVSVVVGMIFAFMQDAAEIDVGADGVRF